MHFLHQLSVTTRVSPRIWNRSRLKIGSKHLFSVHNNLADVTCIKMPTEVLPHENTVFPVTGSVDLWFPVDYRACTVLSIMEHKAKEQELKTAMQAHGFSFPQAWIVVKRQRNLNGKFIAANFSSILTSYGAAHSHKAVEKEQPFHK